MRKEELVQKLGDIEWEDFEVKEAKSEVSKDPVVSSGLDYYKIEFFFDEKLVGKKAREKDTGRDTEKDTEESLEITQLGERLGERLGESDVKIIYFMDKNKKISITELSNKINVSTTAIEKNIAKLKKKGLIKRIGSAKGGSWEVLN